MKAVICEALPPEVCEMCGQFKELRPYGPLKTNGARMWACFDCSMKDKEDCEAAFAEQFEGRS